MLVLFCAALACILLLGFLPVRMRADFRQDALEAILEVSIALPFFRLARTIHVSEQVQRVVDHLLVRWRATGEAVKQPSQKNLRRMLRSKLWHVVARPLRFLGARVNCDQLQVAVYVGGFDAMESALLSAGAWSVLGTMGGLFSHFVKITPSVAALQVIPVFDRPALHVRSSCILRLRLGYAIVAATWVIMRSLSSREVVAWARDSWRRKGDGGDGRASNSGSDEDGHGKP